MKTYHGFNILMDIADLIYSVEYRKGSTKYMAHNLVVYIFNIFAVFVKDTKTPNIIREFKVTNGIKFKYLRMARFMKKKLLEQLNLCVVTSSRQIFSTVHH